MPEIKRAQELGLPGFPVFTHKAHTDLSYLACAHQLLAHTDIIYPHLIRTTPPPWARYYT